MKEETGIFGANHRLNVGHFECCNQIRVVVDTRLVDLADSVGQNPRPRDGEPVVTHLNNNKRPFRHKLTQQRRRRSWFLHSNSSGRRRLFGKNSNCYRPFARSLLPLQCPVVKCKCPKCSDPYLNVEEKFNMRMDEINLRLLPSTFQAPSIWWALVAEAQTKEGGNVS